MLCSESLFLLNYWLNLVGEINIWWQPLFPAAILSCRKSTAWPRFVRHCSWSWQVIWNNFQQQLPCFWTKGFFCMFPVCLILCPQQWSIWQNKCKLLESQDRSFTINISGIFPRPEVLGVWYCILLLHSSCSFSLQKNSQPIYLCNK